MNIGGRTFEVDEAPPLGLLRLRPEGKLFGAAFIVDRMADERRMGAVRYLRGRILPRPRTPQYRLETTKDLPATLEIFLAWVVVQCDLETD